MFHQGNYWRYAKTFVDNLCKAYSFLLNQIVVLELASENIRIGRRNELAFYKMGTNFWEQWRNSLYFASLLEGLYAVKRRDEENPATGALIRIKTAKQVRVSEEM